jgi:hypothetical protein
MKTYLKSFNAVIDIISIILLILFMIYPRNRGISITLFGVLIF